MCIIVCLVYSVFCTTHINKVLLNIAQKKHLQKKKISNSFDGLLTACGDKQYKGQLCLFTCKSLFTLHSKEVWVDKLLGQSVISSRRKHFSPSGYCCACDVHSSRLSAALTACPVYCYLRSSCPNTRKCAELVIFSSCSFLQTPILPKALCVDMYQGKVQITLVIHHAALVAYIMQLTAL